MPDTQIKDGCTIRPSFFSVENPTQAPLLLLAHNAPREACDIAEAAGCRVFRIPVWEKLPSPVSAHPDMLVFPLPSLDCTGKPITTLLLPQAYYCENRSFWDALGIPLALTRHPFGDRYPADIGLNQLVMGGLLYGRLDAAAPELLVAYPERVNVRQGYARCSVLKLTEYAAITADTSLAKVLTERGVEVLLIKAGHIRLDGYNYGFIGGASFPLPDKSVCLFGDLSEHPDRQAMLNFAERQGYRLHTLSGRLSDYGGGILIP